MTPVPPGSRRAVVIGYGNPLRRDDGVGWHVARALAADPRAIGLAVIAAHQLTPEYAEDVHQARMTILVDAKVDGAPLPPGYCTISAVEPPPAEASASAAGAVSSHHCTPESLATMARDLYGSAGPVIVVGVSVSSVAAGELPTPQVARAIPFVVDLVLQLARPCGAASSGVSAVRAGSSMITRTDRLSKRYGGHVALDGVERAVP
ncbi:hydrogenase maturation protease [Dactylosporangium matsuzakiense]|uniref:Hydrogenase maturation protease n=1 Tax=Dactylosporangium matsuzakiense TaxID=53360 RepID=A0A9W6KQL7_9ACTN|nr:hydrogenase maturation protease [Dactylosporangium matsuzakiense]GLL04625.1 hypothetical protein GCM10017581_063720 [Dactylosporangium matsuzakiense]